MTWPVLLDYSKDECKRILRKLELEAYASIISAFRAQGELSKEKKKILQDLSSTLSISVERHRAEIRRAVNDEKLGTIAERMAGPNTSMEWAVEGRRLIPLMPRLVPQTAFTALANNLADMQASKNAAMPIPSATGKSLKIETNVEDNENTPALKRKNSMTSDPSGVPLKVHAVSPSPTTNVSPISEIVQLSPIISQQQQQQILVPLSPITPSQVTPISSTHLTPMTTPPTPITPILSLASSSGSPLTPVSSVSAPIHSTPTQPSILPITITSTLPVPTPSPTSTSVIGMTRGTNRAVNTTMIQRPIAPAIQTGVHHQGIGPASKVILLSGSSSNIPPSILQRCLSVPVVKNMGGPAVTPNASLGTVTKMTSTGPQTLIPVSISGVSNAMVSQVGNNNNMVVYTTTNRGRGGRGVTGIRQAVVRPRPSLVVPIQQQAAAASGMHASSALIGLSGLVSSQQSGNIMKSTGRGGRGKNSGAGRGMKIAPQMMMLSNQNTTTSARILPKPTMSPVSVATAIGNFSSISQASLATSLGSPLVVMGSSNLPASMSKGATLVPTSPRIVNVMSVTPAPTRIMPPANTYSVGTKFAKIAKSSASNIMTVGGGGSQTTSTTSSSAGTPSGAKPNVIVVHKAPPTWQPITQQYPQQQLGKSPMPKSIRVPKGSSATTVSKMLSNMHAASESAKQTTSTSSPIVQSISSISHQLGSQQSPEAFDATQLDPSNLDPKNTLLADLIQAAGIVLPEGTTATMPVTASSFKTLPSNIASSSLRKIAGLTTAPSSSGLLPSSPATGVPVSFPSGTRKGPQMRAPPKSMKQMIPTPKKVITQTIPKLPPSLMITHQTDTDLEEVSVQTSVASKVKVEPPSPVKVMDVKAPPAVMLTPQEKPSVTLKDKVTEKPDESLKVIEEKVTSSSLVLETAITTPSDSCLVSESPMTSSIVTSFHSDIFTADITPETPLTTSAGIELQQDILTTEVPVMVVDKPIDVKAENVKSDPNEGASSTVVEETVVLDTCTTTIVDEAGNPIDQPQVEGQVFEIQASEDVIKMLASGQLTKEVLSLFQKLGVKFDGDTPLTLETTFTEEEIEETNQNPDTKVTEETTTTTTTSTIFTTTTDGISSVDATDTMNIQLVEHENQGKEIEQSGSTLVEVYDSSAETMSLVDSQIDQLSSMEVVQGDDSSAHLVLEPQQVLTAEISTEEYVTGEASQHFVVGECITIDQQHADLIVNEEVIGSADVGELIPMETEVEAKTVNTSVTDVQISNTQNEQQLPEVDVDTSGHETMNLLEELMKQHKDNFN